MLLRQEVEIANFVQDANNYDDERKLVLAGADMLSDPTSDALGILYQAIEGLLIYRANQLNFGHIVWQSLRKHPQLVEAAKGVTDKGMITKAQLAELLEMKPEQIQIGEGYLNTAKPGQDPSLSRVWGNTIQALYVDPLKRSVKDMRPSFGGEANYGTKIAGSRPDPDIGLEGGERIRVGHRRKPIQFAKSLGYQISNAVAAS